MFHFICSIFTVTCIPVSVFWKLNWKFSFSNVVTMITKMKSWENRHASYTCPTLMLFERRKQILYWVMSVSHIAYDLRYRFDIRFAYLRCLSKCVLSWGLLWLRNFNVIVFIFVCLVLVWYLRIIFLCEYLKILNLFFVVVAQKNKWSLEKYDT